MVLPLFFSYGKNLEEILYSVFGFLICGFNSVIILFLANAI